MERQAAYCDEVHPRNACGKFLQATIEAGSLHLARVFVTGGGASGNLMLETNPGQPEDHARPRISRPTRTFSFSDRSPMSLLKGGGSSFTRVGVARMRSVSAISGCFAMSTISIEYFPGRHSSQSCRRLWIASRIAGGAGHVEFEAERRH